MPSIAIAWLIASVPLLTLEIVSFLMGYANIVMGKARVKHTIEIRTLFINSPTLSGPAKKSVLAFEENVASGGPKALP
jgi:hypothetical protein